MEDGLQLFSSVRGDRTAVLGLGWGGEKQASKVGMEVRARGHTRKAQSGAHVDATAEAGWSERRKAN